MIAQRPAAAAENPIPHGYRLLQLAETRRFVGFDLLGGCVRIGDTAVLHDGTSDRVVDRRLIVLSMAALGRSVSETGRKLSISPPTVKSDRAALFSALGLQHRRVSALLPAAVEAGVMRVPLLGSRRNFPVETDNDLGIMRLGAEGLDAGQIAARLSTQGIAVEEQMVTRRIHTMEHTIGLTGLAAVVTGGVVTGWLTPRQPSDKPLGVA